MLPLVLVALIASPGLASAANGDNITATESVSFTKRVADIDSCIFSNATIDWGDGSSSAGQFDTGTTPGVKGTHTYAEDGTFNGSVTYTTDCTTNGKVTFTATVGDAAISAQGRDIHPRAQEQFTGVVSHITDANSNAPASDFTAQINWGDGSPASTGQVSAAQGGGFDVKGTHTYPHSGQAAVNVSVTDVGGSTAGSSSTATIDPALVPIVAKFTYSPTNPCQERDVAFDTSGSQGGTTYRWAFTYSESGYTSAYDYQPASLFHFTFSGLPSPANWSSQPDDTEVHMLRPPVTARLTIRDPHSSVTTDPQTITFKNPDVLYLVATGQKYVGTYWGVAVYEPYKYLKRKNSGVCVNLNLPVDAARADLGSASVQLAGDNLGTPVTCKRGPSCIGTLYAIPTRRPAGFGSHGVASAKRKLRRLPFIAQKTFFIQGGTKRKLVLHLNKAGRRLAHAGKLKRVRLLLVMRGHKPRTRKVKVHRVS